MWESEESDISLCNDLISVETLQNKITMRKGRKDRAKRLPCCRVATDHGELDHRMSLYKPEQLGPSVATGANYRYFYAAEGRQQSLLALAELEATASTRLSVLLTLDAASITSDEACSLEDWSVIRVESDERSGDPMTDRASLSGEASTLDVDVYVVLALGLGELEGAHHIHASGRAREVVFEATTIDSNLTGTVTEVNASGRSLTATSTVTDRAVITWEGRCWCCGLGAYLSVL
jgi:hypothetical protein